MWESLKIAVQVLGFSSLVGVGFGIGFRIAYGKLEPIKLVIAEKENKENL